MSEEPKIRQKGILFRLMTAFEQQASCLEDINEIIDSEVTIPWVSSHPWSENGIPESLDDQVFNVQVEMLEERLSMEIDQAKKDLIQKAVKKLNEIMMAQRDQDFMYLYQQGEERVLSYGEVAGSFFNEHFNNAKSPYYGTRAAVNAYVPVISYKSQKVPRGHG